MKKILSLTVVVALLLCIATVTTAQETTTTLILLRHAEKETTGSDPALSPAGLQRSYKLKSALADYQPDYFFSTGYNRTKQTLNPWATATNKKVNVYNADSLSMFAASLLALEGKTAVVVGHSNTTPQLVNLLIGKEKYTMLDDSVYNKIWIVTIRHGTAMDTVIEY